MKVDQARLLDRLTVEEPCLGAVFCSFTFDPAFFEEQVLRTVLRLSSDPVEQPQRFHDEARRGLQETPVACIVDGAMRRPGRRLPYDLLDYRGRTFHPKVFISLFERFARVAVGSGNLTRSGFSENAELFFVVDLYYAEPRDAANLRRIDWFLRRVAEQLLHVGTQLPLILAELERRIATTAESDAEPSFCFLNTERDRSLLDEALSLLPDGAKLIRAGILAPFHEVDDEGALEREEISSLLARLAHLRHARDFGLDLGLAWDDAPLAPRSDTVPFASGLGELWGCRRTIDDEDHITYFTPTAVAQTQLRCLDASGVSRILDLADAERQRSHDGRIWKCDHPIVHAPRNTIATLSNGGVQVDLWLHPAWMLRGGRPTRRPLHAKLLLLTFRKRAAVQTLVLLGSQNASRAALMRSRSEGANVEAAIAFLVDGDVRLNEFAPDLVWCRMEAVRMEDREFPRAALDIGRFVGSAIHDPTTRTLTINWSSAAKDMGGGWSLRYTEKEIAAGADTPTEATVVKDFTLLPAAAEVMLATGGQECAIPILVSDLVALPSGLAVYDPGLRELLALLGRRIGAERLTTLRAQGGTSTVARVLDAVFGEGFGSVDVYKAWWALAADLAEPTLSVNGFRVRLEGPLGARGVWEKLSAAPSDPQLELTTQEVWLYGSELVKALAKIEFVPGPGTAEKRALLEAFADGLRREVNEFTPRNAPAWFRSVRDFYTVKS